MRDKPKRSLFDGYPDAEELRRVFLESPAPGADEPDPKAPCPMDCACPECDKVGNYRRGGKGALVND